MGFSPRARHRSTSDRMNFGIGRENNATTAIGAEAGVEGSVESEKRGARPLFSVRIYNCSFHSALADAGCEAVDLCEIIIT